MFLDIDRHNPCSTAVIDEFKTVLTYAQLCSLCGGFMRHIEKRSLAFLLCENSIGALIGYIACLSNKTVPLLLDKDISAEALSGLVNEYRPLHIIAPSGGNAALGRIIYTAHGYDLYQTDLEPYPLHDDLALLVTTSGSTGSPKLVRQSYKNIESNTRAIAEYLGITADECPITTLPMNYVYGTSVINSHLLQGAALLLTNKSVTQKGFWDFFREHNATSIAGVPYTYEILKKLRFFNMPLPSLRTMTQAGGKLSVDLHKEFAQYAADTGRQFVIMYGAGEATARMGYLPPEDSLRKCGCMGIAIPGGRFELIDDNGGLIEEANTVGELIYYGDNVTLGYAERGEDLIKGDERGGRLLTGDLAMRDADGYYTVTGRKKRFVKLYGVRVGLDETEQLIKARFCGIQCACGGTDDRLYIFVTDGAAAGEITDFIADYTRINPLAFRVKVIDEIPKNESGKTLYKRLEAYYD